MRRYDKKPFFFLLNLSSKRIAPATQPYLITLLPSELLICRSCRYHILCVLCALVAFFNHKDTKGHKEKHKVPFCATKVSKNKEGLYPTGKGLLACSKRIKHELRNTTVRNPVLLRRASDGVNCGLALDQSFNSNLVALDHSNDIESGLLVAEAEGVLILCGQILAEDYGAHEVQYFNANV